MTSKYLAHNSTTTRRRIIGMNDEGIGIGVWEQESGDAIMCMGFFYLSPLQNGGTGFMYTFSGLPDIEKRAS